MGDDPAGKMAKLGWKLKILLRLFLILVALTLAIGSWRHFQRRDAFILGAKNCTEQHLLAEITAQLIEKKTSIKVVRLFNLEGSRLTFSSLKTGQIDASFEYTGTAWLSILKKPYVPGMLVYDDVKKIFNDQFGLKWLGRIGFSNQYALIARRNSGYTKISQIERVGLKLAIDPEFASRPELKLLKESCPFDEPLMMDQVLLYISLLKKGVDLIVGFSTDGRLLDHRFIQLEDDVQLFPVYEVAPVVRRETLEKFPDLIPIFEKLAGSIHEEEMRQLNYEVEFLHRPVELVAKNFIERYN